MVARLSCKMANGASSGAPFARAEIFRISGTAGMSALRRMTGR